MLSRDCDGCAGPYFDCGHRFRTVQVGKKGYCPDGTAHLADGEVSVE